MYAVMLGATNVRRVLESMGLTYNQIEQSRSRNVNTVFDDEQYTQVEEIDQDISTPVLPDFAAATSEKTTPFKNCWLIDYASHKHIRNSEQRFTDLKEYKGKSLLIGDARTRCESVGTTSIYVTKPNGQKRKVKVENVCYIPGFHTNLLATCELRKKAIYLSEGDGELQFIDGSCCARLKDYHRM